MSRRGWNRGSYGFERPRTEGMKKALLSVLALIASGCGPPDGPYELYYENGQLLEKSTLVAGKPDGPYESYYENGQLKQKGTYVAGEYHGPCESYYENGQLKQKGTFNMGELDGPHEYYYRTIDCGIRVV